MQLHESWRDDVPVSRLSDATFLQQTQPSRKLRVGRGPVQFGRNDVLFTQEVMRQS
jgi:hypothetical protein